mgnify:CR=1 FL=1
MNKITAATAVVIAIIILVLYWETLEQENMFQQELAERLRSEYNGTVSPIISTPDCMVCNSLGCESLGQPCRKVNVTTRREHLEFSVGGNGQVIDVQSTSLVTGGGDDGPETPIPTTCQYQYTAQQGDRTITYTNTGCANPKPTCSIDNTCETCASSQQCIGVIHTSEGSQPLVTQFEIISTPYTGSYNHTMGRCTIDDSVITIYDNSISSQECYDLVASHTICSGGLCAFI